MENIECSISDKLIVDKEGYAIISTRSGRIKHSCEILNISKGDIEKAIITLLGVVTEHIMIIGIDLGKRIAYAVIADHTVIDVGYKDDYKELVSRINELKNKLKPKKVIVRIGMPLSKDLIDVLSSLTEELLRLNYDVYVVNEVKSSKEFEVPTTLLERSLKNIPRDLLRSDDVRAAIILALRGGVRIG
ncbi:MAG: hypothetical protein B6U85_00245 [Desulfurococcales archaeon ex4484_42]|mgnify:CR=1 FL=1|nr:MAG: hypothetical protein B6U85_00245 [Desulfurococcales archaeon ex4484_42]